MQKNKGINTPFIRKMIEILQSIEYEKIICWDQSKTMIEIYDENQLEQKVLRRFFRHNKYESFVRQLNLYGFKKICNNGVNKFMHQDLRNGKKLSEIVSKRIQKKKIQYSSNHQSEVKLEEKSYAFINPQQEINILKNNNKIIPTSNIIEKNSLYYSPQQIFNYFNYPNYFRNSLYPFNQNLYQLYMFGNKH